jgi:hypothetical protein
VYVILCRGLIKVLIYVLVVLHRFIDTVLLSGEQGILYQSYSSLYLGGVYCCSVKLVVSMPGVDGKAIQPLSNIKNLCIRKWQGLIYMREHPWMHVVGRSESRSSPWRATKYVNFWRILCDE